MRFIVTLAFKNLTRYRRRTLITSSAIAFGLMLFLLFDSVIIGVQHDSERNLKAYETGSLRIHQEGYWENRLLSPLDLSIPDPDGLIASLKENGYTAAKRINFIADMILSSSDFGEEGNVSVKVNAVDFERDFKVFGFGDTLIEGRFPREGADEAVIGSWFAEDIGAETGYIISLVTRGNGGFYEVIDLEIVGILNCPNPNVNRTLLMVPFETADYYLEMDGAASEINITLNSFADVEREAIRIREIAQGFRVLTWKELAADYFAFAQADEGAADIMLFLVFIITAVGISNTMLMAVQERQRELGMMRALGMSDVSISIAFLVEAGGIGLVGSIAGMALGAFFNVFLVKYGIDFSFFMRDMNMGYRVSGVMKGVWSLTSFTVTLLTGVFLPMLIAYLPTRRGLKSDIPTCLHHQ